MDEMAHQGAGTLLAVNATMASRNEGPCAVCGLAMMAGSRIARLAGTKPPALIHASCAGKAPGD